VKLTAMQFLTLRTQRSLHYNGRNRHEREEDDEVPLCATFFKFQSCSLEKEKKMSCSCAPSGHIH